MRSDIFSNPDATQMFPVSFFCVGAALFVINFLQTLSKEGLIRLNLSTRRWEYDLSKIRLTEIPADVVQYLTMQMTKLHQNNIQVALKVASCFGSQFGEFKSFSFVLLSPRRA